MKRVEEDTKLDMALEPQTGQTAQTGIWFNMNFFRRALFQFSCQGQTDGQSMEFKVYEALNSAGGTPLQLGATQTLTQGVKVNRAQIVVTGGSTIDETLKITMYKQVGSGLVAQDELTFTAKGAQDLTARQWDQSGTVAQEATSLAACINDATWGVDGLTATVATATVTLEPSEPGEGVFTYTESSAGELVAADILQQGYFSVDVDELTALYDYVGARVASVDATTEFACALLRTRARHEPQPQSVAAYDDSS